MPSNASNVHGKCIDSPVWLTREPDQNAVGDAFKGILSNVPYVGGLAASLVSDTATQNVIRTCPGATTDWTPDYSQEYTLMALIVVLIITYLIV